jgi:molecular chaperone DnaJ
MEIARVIVGMTSKRDYYGILGISKEADKKQIKKVYRKLALRYHPDRNKSPDAEERFKQINVAYVILSDDDKRQRYDSLEIVTDEKDIDFKQEDVVITTPPVTPTPLSDEEVKVSRFSILIDPTLCLAFGSCETLAPKVFIINQNVQFNPKAVVADELGADIETILDAAQTCPTRAIIIIDKVTGEQIYP